MAASQSEDDCVPTDHRLLCRLTTTATLYSSNINAAVAGGAATDTDGGLTAVLHHSGRRPFTGGRP